MIDPFDVVDEELHKRNASNRPQRDPSECWGNMYSDFVALFATREKADQFAGPDRVRLIHYREVPEVPQWPGSQWISIRPTSTSNTWCYAEIVDAAWSDGTPASTDWYNVQPDLDTVQQALNEIREGKCRPIQDFHTEIQVWSLRARIEGMIAENESRARCGLGPAYGKDDFQRMADQLNALRADK
jgi:hypothetical protein